VAGPFHFTSSQAGPPSKCSSEYHRFVACTVLYQLPPLPSGDHAHIAAELAGSRAAAAASRAATAALRADLRAAGVTTASLRKQLKEAEVARLAPAPSELRFHWYR
jgi:hypothetical protein